MARMLAILAGGKDRFAADRLAASFPGSYHICASDCDGASLAAAYAPGESPLSECVLSDGRAPDSEKIQKLLRAVRRSDTQEVTKILNLLEGPFAIVLACDGHLFAARSRFGVAPLYVGSYEGKPCFASEIKLFSGWATGIEAVPAGTWCIDGGDAVRFAPILPHGHSRRDLMPDEWAAELRETLQTVIAGDARDGDGVLLSGGLDSSAIAALAAEAGYRCVAFTAAWPGGEDLAHAQALARKLGWEHFCVTPTLHDLLEVLPDVIRSLESFDAPLVRSAVINFLVDRLAAKHVSTLLCGEGADELFGGYAFLKQLAPDALQARLGRLLQQLPGGGLQRVDRMASANALTAKVPFLDARVVDLAWQMPPEIKIGPNCTEKWVLREACAGILPENIRCRAKQKFSVGCGSAEALAEHFEQAISDAEFERCRALPDGSRLRSKEELHYFRLFVDFYGPDAVHLVARTLED